MSRGGGPRPRAICPVCVRSIAGKKVGEGIIQLRDHNVEALRLGRDIPRCTGSRMTVTDDDGEPVVVDTSS